ncbi:MAG: hypothetical protein LBD57_02735 [Endomicrobium sp.]|jgi:predicted AAA+ superfamily ATPase|nr:hypothetical protein [Endomicrobium sp.]
MQIAELIPHETLIFIDEIQIVEEVITLIKFLAERYDYDFILVCSYI